YRAAGYRPPSRPRYRSRYPPGSPAACPGTLDHSSSGSTPLALSAHARYQCQPESVPGPETAHVSLVIHLDLAPTLYGLNSEPRLVQSSGSPADPVDHLPTNPESTHHSHRTDIGKSPPARPQPPRPDCRLSHNPSSPERPPAPLNILSAHMP